MIALGPNRTEPLKVAIDAQLESLGDWGGVEQFVTGLLHALGRFSDGSIEYTVVGHWRYHRRLRPYLGACQRLAITPPPKAGHWERAKRLLGPLRRPMRAVHRGIHPQAAPESPETPNIFVPESDGFYEALGVDLLHFPHQRFIRCSLPTIFNPHDLQHLQFPQFFSKEDAAWREAIYRAGCSHAQAIAAESRWVKGDIVRRYHVDARKVYAILRGSPTQLYDQTTGKILAKAKRKFRLPEAFAFYPAQTWAHKNHIRLLEALRLLRDRDGLAIHLVCTGKKNSFWPQIEARIRKLKLDNQVNFLGFVSPSELRAIYHLAEFLVFPSLFEGGGFPITEAFQEGAPVACSCATSLPEYGGDAVLLFDPTSTESMAQALRRMSADARLRETLRQRGSGRIRLFEWERTARTYQALYRKVGGRPLSREDCALLEET